jgi:hypothetical protein
MVTGGVRGECKVSQRGRTRQRLGGLARALSRAIAGTSGGRGQSLQRGATGR